ncbi:MAG: hypothetical protein QGG42_12490 [Phycisphaerae bacterium]|jgi:hypothetical protein|nr:hypothetical protein [Phycisphaerae bacterium]
MKRIVLLGLIAISLTSVGGCVTRAAKEAILTPKGFAVPTKPVGSKQDSYSKVQLEDFSNTGITTMPPNINQLLRDALAEKIADLKPKKAILTPGAARTLLVRGKYIYYEEAGGILNQAFGPFEEIIALVELVDQPSGKVAARGYCIGRTGTTRLQGPKRKAEGLAKAIIDFFRKSCKTPPPPE